MQSRLVLIMLCAAMLLPGGCNPFPRSLVLSNPERAELARIAKLPPDEAAAARRAIADAQPAWSEQARAAVAAGEIYSGMTMREVLFAWGIPASRGVFPPSVGDMEEWHFGDFSPRIYLTIDMRKGTCGTPHYGVWYQAYPEHGSPPMGRHGYRLAPLAAPADTASTPGPPR